MHAALSASAGTGKTQVLTARVLRLLLQGARPDSILCLTFTKAAAAEMANRIGGRLAAWVRLPDQALNKELFALGEIADPPTRQRARRLFAKVLDAPGGLKIQTIHAFAQSLLAAFPAEAEIVPGFQPIEGRAEQELVRRTLADLLAGAEQGGDGQLIADVQCLSRRLGETGAVEYLQACARRADSMAAFGSPDAIEAPLRKLIELARRFGRRLPRRPLLRRPLRLRPVAGDRRRQPRVGRLDRRQASRVDRALAGDAAGASGRRRCPTCRCWCSPAPATFAR